MKPLLFFVLLSATVNAQLRDSVQIEYSQEPLDSTRLKLEAAFRYITRATVEEKTLVKLGVISPLPSYFGGIGAYGSVGLFAGVERKLLPSLSVQAAVTNRYSYYGKLVYVYSLELPLESRFYYSINRRIRKRKSANNFSNNYLGVSLSNVLFAKAQYNGYDPVTETYSREKRSIRASGAFGQAVVVKWGCQRRIGLRGHVDFSVDIGFLRVLPNQKRPLRWYDRRASRYSPAWAGNCLLSMFSPIYPQLT